MKLSKDQNTLLIYLICYIAAMIVFNALLLIFGNRTWEDIWPTGLGMLIGAIGLYVFLIIGSRVPKKKDEDKK